MEIAYRFGFDAAHRFDSFPAGHPNHRMHGHSFQVEVAVRGEPGADGFVLDFARLEAECGRVREALDHRLLNEVEGLQAPSLEHLALWMWRALEPRVPQLARITVRRDSCGQSCTYEGR